MSRAKSRNATFRLPSIVNVISEINMYSSVQGIVSDELIKQESSSFKKKSYSVNRQPEVKVWNFEISSLGNRDSAYSQVESTKK